MSSIRTISVICLCTIYLNSCALAPLSSQWEEHYRLGSDCLSCLLYTSATEELLHANELAGRFPQADPRKYRSVSALANCYLQSGHALESEPYYRQLVAMDQQNHEVSNLERLDHLHSLGDIYLRLHRPREAQLSYQNELSLAQKLFGPDNPSTAQALAALGATSLMVGELGQSAKYHEQALAIISSLFGKDNLETTEYMVALADIYLLYGHFSKAEAMLNQAYETRKRLLGPQDPVTVLTKAQMGDVYASTGRYTQAEHCYRLGLNFVEASPDKSIFHKRYEYLVGLARLYRFRLIPAEAEKYFRAAIQAMETDQGKDDPTEISALDGLACSLNDQRRFAEALQIFQRATPLIAKYQGAESISMAEMLWKSGSCCQSLGDNAAAERYYLRASDIFIREIESGKGPDVLGILSKASAFYASQDRLADAEQFFIRFADAYQKAGDRIHQANIQMNLANLYLKLRHYREAVAWSNKSLAAIDAWDSKSKQQEAARICKLKAGRLFILGEFNQSRGNAKESIDNYEESLALSPSGYGEASAIMQVETLNRLSWLYFENQDQLKLSSCVARLIKLLEENAKVPPPAEGISHNTSYVIMHIQVLAQAKAYAVTLRKMGREEDCMRVMKAIAEQEIAFKQKLPNVSGGEGVSTDN